MALAACGARPLRLASHQWPGYALIQAACTEGLIASDDVTLIHSADAPATIRLLSQAEADAATLTLDEVLQARAQGQDLRVAAVLDVSAGADALIASPGIRLLSQLRGRRIGLEQGAVGNLVARKALEAARVGLDEVSLLDLPLAAQGDALRSGRIDALVCFEPLLGQLEAQGFRRLFDSRSMPYAVLDVLAVRQAAISPAALTSVIAGHLLLRERLLSDPQDGRFALAPHLGVQADRVPDLYRGLILPGLHMNHEMLREGGSVARAAQELHRYMRSLGMLKNEVDLRGLCGTAYLPLED
ncbi:ABC transporter substrate-binding protein [Paucibacter soli]|uniref:ABC transporter substrate-binding protein n=1 Tax=Paucibacter soli TaxID=3133433 RepID=UPI0030A7D2F5